MLGGLGGVLSSEAMLQSSGSNIQGPLTFVPESNNSESNDMVLVRNDDEISRLVTDWNNLRRDFGTWLSGGRRSDFDARLSRGLHPICQFIGENVLLRVVDSFNQVKTFEMEQELALLEWCREVLNLSYDFLKKELIFGVRYFGAVNKILVATPQQRKKVMLFQGEDNETRLF